MKKGRPISRRCAMEGIGAAGLCTILGTRTADSKGQPPGKAPLRDGTGTPRKAIFDKVLQTPLIDTHEHLIEERERLAGTAHPRVRSDDWSLLCSHYLNSDMIVAGMPRDSHDKFLSPKTDPVEKWALLEPYWPAIKNTGYGQAVSTTLKQLYGVEELSGRTVRKVQSEYEKLRRPGFYRHILRELANIESCQVNCLSRPFNESDMPTLLMQDLSIVGMFSGPAIEEFGKPSGIETRCLSDWHKVIDWWFDRYAKYAVAVKSQNAYGRDIDYEQVSAEKADVIFARRLANEPLNSQEQKMLEDHLFWYAVETATRNNLPVKLHTGYYAGQNSMPLGRLAQNPSSATELCRTAPDTKFVFMHIAYPYYEQMIAAAKHYSNAYVDMCWAWIINPVAAKDFLKKYLVAAPANKILTFGGDYVPVEPVLGHAAIARRGIALALSELVEEGWLSLSDATETAELIMHQNARRIFNLEKKTQALKNVKWAR